MRTITALILLSITTTVSAFDFNGKEYNIYVPENIQQIEYCVLSQQCEYTEYQYKLVFANLLLIKYGYTPIY